MARESEPRTALGEWLWAKVAQRGFRRRLDFIHALGYSASTVNDWTRASVASVPERKAIGKLADVLKLNREEREELQELVSQQEQRIVSRERTVEPEPTALVVEPEASTRRTGPGRWERYAERYWTFSAQATVALARGIPPAALDAASDYLGAQKGDGPTEEQANAAISRYARQIAADEPVGREAGEDEFVTPKRGKK